MQPSRLFLLLLVAWVILRGVLLFCAWLGDNDDVRRARVLAHFSSEDIAKGKAYLGAHLPASVVAGYLVPGVLFWLYLSGYFRALFLRIERISGGHYWLTGILFVLAFLAVRQVLALPFSFYSGHLVESRLGFSNMTVWQWWLLYLKSVIVSWTTQLVVIIGVFGILRASKEWWPLTMPLAFSAFGVAMILLVPYLVTPLFYHQTPLPDGELKDRITQIAQTAGVPLEGIFQIDASRYSKHTNAYFTGLFGNKRIVLYDTLIKNHTPAEAACIFAHEVGHWQHDHMRIGLTLGFLGAFLTCLLVSRIFPWLQSDPALFLGPITSFQNVPFWILAGLLVNLFLTPVEAQISQHFERQADWAALELSDDPDVYVNSEIRLARDNHNDLLPHPLRVFWLHSHPPAIDRIAMGEEWRARQAATTTQQEFRPDVSGNVSGNE